MTFSPFPNRILAADKKGKDFTLLMAKAIHYTYEANTSSICKRDSILFAENRLYASGDQSVERYKDHFALETDNKSEKRKGVGNMDYSIVPFAPNFINTSVALLSDKTNRTNVVFLNDISDDKRKKKVLEMQTDIETKDFTNEIGNIMGVKPPEKQGLPETVEDLNLLEQVGGIKLELETALELGIDYVFNYDMQWEKRFSSPIKRNLLSNAFGIVVDSVNPVTGMIEIRTPNIEKIILDGSADNDYTDMQYFGEMRQMTVLDVYNQVKATTKEKVTEDQLRSLGLSGNVDYNGIYSNSWFDAPENKDLHGFLPERVNVLDFVYKTVDIIDDPVSKGEKVYIKGRVRKSEIKSGKIKEDGKGYYKTIGKKKKKLEVTVWRRGKWVVNTDIVFDYGLSYDQVRNNSFKPISPVHAFRITGKSLISIIKPNLDALQFDMLKIQNLKNQATGYAVAIDYDGLSNIKMGGEDYNVKKLIRLYKLNNTLLYKRKNTSNPNDKIQGSPITELQGGMGNFYQELITDIQFHIGQMQINTGLNDVALAKSPNPEVTFGQSQQAMSASNNAIANVYKAYKSIKESVAYSIAIRLQNLAKAGKGKQYEAILGKDMWKSLKTDDISLKAQGIKIMDNPSREEIQMIFQNMQRLAPNTLTGYDMFLLESMITEGKPLKAIAAIMESKVRKREEEASKNNEMMMKQNGEQQQAMQNYKLSFEGAKEEFKIKSGMATSEQDFTQQRILQQEEYDLKLRNETANDRLEAELNGQFTKDNS